MPKKNKFMAQEDEPIIGGGFEQNDKEVKEDEPIIGRGFEQNDKEVKEDEPIIGRGFEQNDKEVKEDEPIIGRGFDKEDEEEDDEHKKVEDSDRVQSEPLFKRDKAVSKEDVDALDIGTESSSYGNANLLNPDHIDPFLAGIGVYQIFGKGGEYFLKKYGGNWITKKFIPNEELDDRAKQFLYNLPASEKEEYSWIRNFSDIQLENDARVEARLINETIKESGLFDKVMYWAGSLIPNILIYKGMQGVGVALLKAPGISNVASYALSPVAKTMDFFNKNKTLRAVKGISHAAAVGGAFGAIEHTSSSIVNKEEDIDSLGEDILYNALAGGALGSVVELGKLGVTLYGMTPFAARRNVIKSIKESPLFQVVTRKRYDMDADKVFEDQVELVIDPRLKKLTDGELSVIEKDMPHYTPFQQRLLNVASILHPACEGLKRDNPIVRCVSSSYWDAPTPSLSYEGITSSVESEHRLYLSRGNKCAYDVNQSCGAYLKDNPSLTEEDFMREVLYSSHSGETSSNPHVHAAVSHMREANKYLIRRGSEVDRFKRAAPAHRTFIKKERFYDENSKFDYEKLKNELKLLNPKASVQQIEGALEEYGTELTINGEYVPEYRIVKEIKTAKNNAARAEKKSAEYQALLDEFDSYERAVLETTSPKEVENFNAMKNRALLKLAGKLDSQIKSSEANLKNRLNVLEEQKGALPPDEYEKKVELTRESYSKRLQNKKSQKIDYDKTAKEMKAKLNSLIETNKQRMIDYEKTAEQLQANIDKESSEYLAKGNEAVYPAILSPRSSSKDLVFPIIYRDAESLTAKNIYDHLERQNYLKKAELKKEIKRLRPSRIKEYEILKEKVEKFEKYMDESEYLSAKERVEYYNKFRKGLSAFENEILDKSLLEISENLSNQAKGHISNGIEDYFPTVERAKEYHPIKWDAEKIINNKEQARKAFTRSFIETGAASNQQSANKIFDEFFNTMETLTQNGEQVFNYSYSKMASNLKQRKLSVIPKDLIDFMDLDLQRSISSTFSHMGFDFSKQRMCRDLGFSSWDDMVSKAKEWDMLSGATKDEQNKTVSYLNDLSVYLARGKGMTDPKYFKLNKRLEKWAGYLQAYSYMRYCGGIGMTVIDDMAISAIKRPLCRHIVNTVRSFSDKVNLTGLTKKELEVYGVACDTLMSSQRFLIGGEEPYAKFLKNQTNRFTKMTGITYIDDARSKDIIGAVLYDASKFIVDGESPLGVKYAFSKKSKAAIKEEILKYSNLDPENFALRTESWSYEASRDMMAEATRQLRQEIIRPSYGSRAKYINTPFGKLFTMFESFKSGVSYNVLLPLLYEKKYGTLFKLMANGFSLGVLKVQLKATLKGDPYDWDDPLLYARAFLQCPLGQLDHIFNPIVGAAIKCIQGNLDWKAPSELAVEAAGAIIKSGPIDLLLDAGDTIWDVVNPDKKFKEYHLQRAENIIGALTGGLMNLAYINSAFETVINPGIIENAGIEKNLTKKEKHLNPRLKRKRRRIEWND